MKTTADLKKKFKEKVITKLPGGYIPAAIQLKYIEWLEELYTSQQHPIDENQIEKLWGKYVAVGSGLKFEGGYILRHGFESALKELSTQQPSEDHYKIMDASKELPPKSEDSDLSDVVFTIDEEDYKDYDSYDHKIKKWENPHVFKGYYDTPVKYWLKKVKGHSVTEGKIKLVLSTTLQAYGNDNTSWIGSGSLDQAAKAIASLYRKGEG